ncbi:flippase [Thiothrix subterranea]|uniref:Flippase n=2 Tax=Thiothrix subterranea TaxID=2735563 RepID=A0AA51R4S7_9GAMM|nr:flippase [Thiothrix subterranea]MDQ5768387.1 flippase [Thiothrix subterranea]WML86975.1 flippase [Thiothrix subterranea]
MNDTRKNVVFTGVGYALPLLAALATIPIIVVKLGVDLYGLYIICISLIGFMTFVDFGIGQTVVKYVAEYEATDQSDRVKPVLDVALLIYLLIGLFGVVCLYTFSPLLAKGLYWQPDKQVLATEALRITAVPLFLSYLNQFFLNVCKAYHRFDLPAIIHNSGNLGGIVLTTGLLLAGYGLIEVLWGYAFVQFIAIISGYLASVAVLPRGIKPRPAFQQSVFMDIISFSSYTFLGNLVGSLVSRADKLLIGIVIGTEAVTYYQIPFTIAQMANGIIHTLVHIAFPRFTEMFSLNDRAGVLKLYRLANNLVFLLSLVIAVLLITVGDDFLTLWISAEFAQKAGVVLQVMALYFFLHSNTVVGYWVLQGAGQAKLTAFMAIAGGIAYFAALYYLGSKYAYMGAALALFFTLSATALQYIWIARHIGHSFTEYLGQLLAFFLGGYAVIYLMEHVNVWLSDHLLEIIVSAALALGLLIVGMWLLLARNGRETKELISVSNKS